MSRSTHLVLVISFLCFGSCASSETAAPEPLADVEELAGRGDTEGLLRIAEAHPQNLNVVLSVGHHCQQGKDLRCVTSVVTLAKPLVEAKPTEFQPNAALGALCLEIDDLQCAKTHLERAGAPSEERQ